MVVILVLADKTAFVTGASQNIGREIALTLADRGANVAIAARSDGIYETAELIDDPDRTLPVEVDLTDTAAVEDAIEATADTFGGLDILVNNAGVPGPTSPIEETGLDEWNHVFDVNLLGQVRTIRAAVPHLRESDAGRIVNIASTAAKDVVPEKSPYNTSKSAVIGLSRSLAAELGADNITVNAVCPGATDGERIERSISQQAENMGVSFEEAKERLFTGDAALSTLVETQDTAALVAFLVSDEARYISGQDLNVDAGACFE
ncbi:Enoyl-(Acyl carrier protein) reductase [Halobellus clavatus]|uniref:Enoyl-(Acyl carrier protein) reductase n=1 Tax=Halobellus clavatus TaxID=660517 RepID=A0A1H3E7T6_9EURY|nr:Enoyl-(Acyl carrier protein) reductase [Halobellus clavatus]